MLTPAASYKPMVLLLHPPSPPLPLLHLFFRSPCLGVFLSFCVHSGRCCACLTAFLWSPPPPPFMTSAPVVTFETQIRHPFKIPLSYLPSHVGEVGREEVIRDDTPPPRLHYLPPVSPQRAWWGAT